jgi:hypothetical protein
VATYPPAADVGTLGIIIGTAKDWRVTLKSAATNLPLALGATDKVVFTARRATGGAVLFTRRNSAAGGTDAELALVDGPGGVVDVKVVEANTSSLAAAETLNIELRYELASDGKDRTAFTGRLYCVPGAGAAIP